MTQIALPLDAGPGASLARIVIGSANAAVIDACGAAANWPFRNAILTGPPRSGKSLLTRWFVHGGMGEAIDDAWTLDETELFHRWNRAQEAGSALLLVGRSRQGGESSWQVTLPDLASRLGAALHLEIGAPDDAMLAGLIAAHAEARGLVLGDGAAAYLVPRCERSHLGVERLVTAIDQLSLERKLPATQSIWRDALEALVGESQPRLL